MEDNTVVEGNKLIHIFYKEFKGDELGMWQVRHLDKCKYLKYHEDWTLLMPVWIKISKMIAPADGKGITVQEIMLCSDNLFAARINYRTKFSGIGSKHKWIEHMDADPIKATWKTVVQFIRWYTTTNTMESNLLAPEPESDFEFYMKEVMDDLAAYDNETDRINMRIFKAIENQIGKGFLNDLKALIEDSECKDRFSIVDNPTGKFQQESGFGCITGIWVTQYSVGMEGDSWAGTIWVKLKDYKYLEMPFSC